LCFVFKVQETDSGKPVVCFAVVMDLQDSSSLPSSAAASTAGSRSASDQTLAWVISHQLQDFVILHQQLLKVSRFLCSHFFVCIFQQLIRRHLNYTSS